MQTKNEMEYLSNCCGAGENELMICGDCKEHCAFTNENDLTREEQIEADSKCTEDCVCLKCVKERKLNDDPYQDYVNSEIKHLK